MLLLAHMEINVLIDKAYKKQVKSGWLKNLVRQIQTAEKVSVKSEMAIVITGDEKIHEQNQRLIDALNDNDSIQEVYSNLKD